ncbi:MAG TPA: hypothetical protein VFK05_33005 [Polyangiaceae bacterium]|nr:hypothetical protein [Polyangiaceae bacterium]
MFREAEGRCASVDLAELAKREQSGEFICASSAVEVHVHLQAGRVAWATDSRHAFAFTRHLQEHAALSLEQFRDVLEECRRSRLPLGETLVAWGLVSAEQVRAALRHQISCALKELPRLQRGQQVFLGRAKEYQQYASELTFELAEFSEELAEARRPSSLSPAPGLVREIRDAVSDVTWIEVLEGESVSDQDPPDIHARVPIPVLKLTLLDGAELVTLRSARGTLVGVSLRAGRTLWCRVAVDSTFGSAVSALSAVAGFDRVAPANARRSPDGDPRWLLGSRTSPALRELEDFLGRAPDLAACLVVAPLSTPHLRGVGMARIDEDFCVDIVRRRASVFGLAKEVFADGAGLGLPDLQGMGFRYLSLATAEAGYWCFGAELAEPEGASVWTFVERHAGQGLGWAYLSALTRRLEALPDWEAHE